MDVLDASPAMIKEKNKGIFQIKGSIKDVIVYLEDTLDLQEFKDFVLVANRALWIMDNYEIDGTAVKYYPLMLHFVSDKGYARFVQSGVGVAARAGVTIVQKWSIPDLKKAKYELW
jgi:hypothetical protein